jgi:hypothetical protein
MNLAAIFLGLAALGGITIVAMRLSGQPHPPTWLALVHGAIAATGLGILAYTAATVGVPQRALIALGIFVLAALGGTFVFLTYHLKDLPLPIPLILGHGITALVGFALLMTTIFQNAGP